MIKENKITKYLLYALGEIVLVIIGIVFALQINNWNENRKTQIDLESSLYAMIEELKENANYIKGQNKIVQNQVEGLNRVFDKTATEKDLKTILKYFGPDTDSRPFANVFNSLKEEKKLRLIENKELIRKINDFYEYTLPNMEEFTKWHEGFVGNNIDPYVLENIPIINNNSETDIKTVKRLMEEVKFINILRYQKTLYTGYQGGCNSITQKAEALITMIDNYLNNQKQ